MLLNVLSSTIRQLLPALTDLPPRMEEFQPTLHDADVVRALLEHKVPAEIAIRIVALGYYPRVTKTIARREIYRAGFTSNDFILQPEVAGLYLATDPIPSDFDVVVPLAITFTIRAADQGWADFGGNGTFENSHTWFEASILRPFSPSEGGGEAGEEEEWEDAEEDEEKGEWENEGEGQWRMNLAKTRENGTRYSFRDARSARSWLNEGGWDYVEDEKGRISWRVSNNRTAQRDFEEYVVTWRKGVETVVEDDKAVGKGEGFLERLRAGDVVVLWARAEERAWLNKVASATVEIELQVP